MNEILTEYMEKIWQLEAEGFVDETMQIFDAMLRAYPDAAEDIMLEKAKLEFRNMRDREALLDFIGAYSVRQSEEIYDLVLEAYLEPNFEELRGRYEKNMQILQKYPYYKSDFQEGVLSNYVIWKDEEILCCVDTDTKLFTVVKCQTAKELEQSEDSILLINELWMDNVRYYQDKVRPEQELLDLEIPLYLVYDPEYWNLYLQTEELSIPEKNKLVYLVGERSFQDFFRGDAAIIPYYQFGYRKKVDYSELLNQIVAEKEKKYQEYKFRVSEYYRDIDIVKRIREGNPKILFMTSRFTTALQYHTRDCLHAAQRLGCEVELLIDPTNIHRITALEITECLSRFQPDIIFVLDHFRMEQNINIPENAIWITWVQDPMPLVMSKETPLKLGKYDFVMNHFISWKELLDVGYSDYCMIDAPVPADAHIYRPQELTSEEEKNYSCDICFVCHASDAAGHIKEIKELFPPNLSELLDEIYNTYHRQVYELGRPYYGQEDFRGYLEGMLKDRCPELLESPILMNYLTNDMYMWYSQSVYRQCLVDWILEAGYTNVKLWGSGWVNVPKYEKYAMGPAENGATLSKIYQASKIVLGNNVGGTAAARAWESMLSGAFYMSNYIPGEYDKVDIRKVIEAEKDVVMFRDREDLLEKISYYLEHENERREMAERGRKVALEKMTYDALMERVLREVRERLSQADNEGD